MSKVFLLYFAIGIGMAMGDVCMKHWISGASAGFPVKTIGFYLLGLGFYVTSLTTYAFLLRTNQFGAATFIPMLLNIGIVFLVATFVFKESPNVFTGIGFFLGVASIAFFAYGTE